MSVPIEQSGEKNETGMDVKGAKAFRARDRALLYRLRTDGARCSPLASRLAVAPGRSAPGAGCSSVLKTRGSPIFPQTWARIHSDSHPPLTSSLWPLLGSTLDARFLHPQLRLADSPESPHYIFTGRRLAHADGYCEGPEALLCSPFRSQVLVQSLPIARVDHHLLNTQDGVPPAPVTCCCYRPIYWNYLIPGK